MPCQSPAMAKELITWPGCQPDSARHLRQDTAWYFDTNLTHDLIQNRYKIAYKTALPYLFIASSGLLDLLAPLLRHVELLLPASLTVSRVSTCAATAFSCMQGLSEASCSSLPDKEAKKPSVQCLATAFAERAVCSSPPAGGRRSTWEPLSDLSTQRTPRKLFSQAMRCRRAAQVATRQASEEAGIGYMPFGCHSAAYFKLSRSSMMTMMSQIPPTPGACAPCPSLSS